MIINANFLNSTHSLQGLLHSWKQLHYFYRVLYLNDNWWDLRNLTTFTAGDGSFKRLTSLSLSGISFQWLPPRSSSTYIIHYRTLVVPLHNLIDFIGYLMWIVIDTIFLDSQHSLQDGIHSLKQRPSPSQVHLFSYSHQMSLSLTEHIPKLMTTHSNPSPHLLSPPIPVYSRLTHHIVSQPLKQAILNAHGERDY